MWQRLERRFRRRFSNAGVRSNFPALRIAVDRPDLDAVGRQGRMILSYVEDTPWEYVRDDSLPPGIHLKKIEHIPLEHIKRLLDHLRSLETDQTYEAGLIFIPKYEGLPKVRHRKSKKQKLLEVDRLASPEPRGSHESEHESESEEKQSPSPPATTLPTIRVNGPQVQHNAAAAPDPKERLINGMYELFDYAIVLTLDVNTKPPDFDTAQTTHPLHSQRNPHQSTVMNTQTVTELGSSRPDDSCGSSLPPTHGRPGVNPNQLSFTVGPEQLGKYAGSSVGSNGGLSSMQEKPTHPSGPLLFQAALSSRSPARGTILLPSSSAMLGLNGQGIDNGSTPAFPRLEYSGIPPGHNGQSSFLDDRFSSAVGDVHGSKQLEVVMKDTPTLGKDSEQSGTAVSHFLSLYYKDSHDDQDDTSLLQALTTSRTASPRSAGTSLPTAIITSSPDNHSPKGGDADADADKPSKTPSVPPSEGPGEEEEEGVDPSRHLDPSPPPANKEPEEQGQDGPSPHLDPPPPPAGPNRKGSKKPAAVETSAKTSKKGTIQKGAPKVLDNPRPATRSATSKKRPHEDPEKHSNKRQRV
jgi:hypothetical protein